MKTLVVGFDGACWEYLDPLLADGRLANIAALIDRGYRGVLRSVMPPITPVAWSSIVTGVNPGKHGVFEWVRENPATSGMVPVNSVDQKATPFWELLNEAGVQVGLVNVPLTYPPRPIDGFVLCGFSTPSSARDLSYPESILGEVEREFGSYIPDVSGRTNGHEPGHVYDAERDYQARQIRIATYLAKKHDVDVLIINLMLLDHANHTLEEMERIDLAAIDTDQHIGDLVRDFAPDNVLLISDHGSRRLDGVFLLGAWLAEHNYLSWATKGIRERRRSIHFLLAQEESERRTFTARMRRLLLSLAMSVLPRPWVSSWWSALEESVPLAALQASSTQEVDASTSYVYTIGARRGNLRLNMQDREPMGTLAQSERSRWVTKLSNHLGEVLDPTSGQPLFNRIFDSREAYGGVFAEDGPDLIGDYYGSRWGMAMKLPGLRPRSTRYFQSNEGMTGWFGDHSVEGIYIAAGRDFRSDPFGEPASLLDIAPTLLYLYDVSLPLEYDGHPLLHSMKPQLTDSKAVRYRENKQQEYPQEEPENAAGQDEAELLRRLADLGYVE